jgi:hypothetical protein
MDRLGLPDEVIPHLRNMINETCSSRWEHVLTGPPWGLRRKDAQSLANSMYRDLTGKKVCGFLQD